LATLGGSASNRTRAFAREPIRINRVAVDVSGDPYVDLEREAVAMFMRQ